MNSTAKSSAQSNEPSEQQRLSHRDNILAGYYTRQDIIGTKQWPLRRTHTRIESVRQLKETLRAGAYAWPGGYPLYFITADSEPLSFEAAREQLREIMEAMTTKYAGPCWRIVRCEINWEDGELYCSHTNKRIESAYNEPEETDPNESELPDQQDQLRAGEED